MSCLRSSALYSTRRAQCPAGPRRPDHSRRRRRRCEDVELLTGFGQQQRTTNERPQRIGREVLVELAMINSNGALAGAKENSGGGRFAAARCVVFDVCQLCDLDLPGLLGGMWMVGTGVHLQLSIHRITHFGLRQHAANRFLHQADRLALPHDSSALLAQSAFVPL